MPTKQPDKPVAGKLIDRVIARIDMETLAQSLADKLGEKLMQSLSVDDLVTKLFDKHGDDMRQGLTDAILEHL